MWGLPVGISHLEWNMCPPFLTWIQSPIDVMVLSEIPRYNIFKRAISGKSCGYMLLICERCYTCERLTWRTKVNSDCFIGKKKQSLKAHLFILIPHEMCQHCWSPVVRLGHTCVPITEPITKFGWGVCHIHPTDANLHHQIFICFVIGEVVQEETTTQIKRHCIMPWGSGCKWRRVTYTKWQYMLLYKGGRRLFLMEKTI